jgi:hypothetical protein
MRRASRGADTPDHGGTINQTPAHFSEFLKTILIRDIYGKIACGRYGRRRYHRRARVDRGFKVMQNE